MEKNHQRKIVEAMMHPDFYPHPVASVGRRETHISTVFLTGTFVYKIKKSVDLGFLDFTSLEKRQHFLPAGNRLEPSPVPWGLQSTRFPLPAMATRIPWEEQAHRWSMR